MRGNLSNRPGLKSSSTSPAELLEELEGYWPLWLLTLFPGMFAAPHFAQHHLELWEWAWSLTPGVRPQPFVAIWPRGAAKSTTAELAVVALGARKLRRYGLYVCNTQEQADDHVANIAGLLEARTVELFYPELASRALSKYGHAKGWRRNRVRTASGLTVDAMGLDSAARGAKVDDDRPSFMVFDDLDSEQDTVATTGKKIRTLTRKLIPAGAPDLAILAIQNLVHENSIFAQLSDGRADFMLDRVVSGPVAAVDGLTYVQRDGRFVLTGGEPTWLGMPLARCQEMVDDMGLTAFLAECQHDVEAPPGGMYSHLEWQRCTWAEVPKLRRKVVWVDPAVTDTDDSDSYAIQADGLGVDGKLYRLFSWEQRTSPDDALRRAIAKANELGAESVGVETDQGGDTWRSVYEKVAAGFDRVPRFRADKAGAGHGGKVERSARMLAEYERGNVVHVEGTHLTLERALRRFPKTKPFDLADAAYWGWSDLMGKPPRPTVSPGGVSGQSGW